MKCLLAGWVLGFAFLTSLGASGDVETDRLMFSGSDDPLAALRSAPPVASTIQIYFPTGQLNRPESVLSSIQRVLPYELSEYSFQTFGRGIHTSVAYLMDFTFDDLLRLREVLKSITPEEIRAEGLDRPVRVLDFSEEGPRVIKIGQNSKFLALVPHREFAEHQARKYLLLARKSEWFNRKAAGHFDGHDLSSRTVEELASHVHLSLLQAGEPVGRPFSDTKMVEDARRLEHIFLEHWNRIRSNGNSGVQWFDPSRDGYRITAPPESFTSGSRNLAHYTFDERGVSFGHVWAFYAPLESNRLPSRVEFSFDSSNRPVFRNETAQSTRFKNRNRSFGSLGTDQVTARLSGWLRDAWRTETSRNTISPTRLPSAPVSENAGLVVLAETHPSLVPERGREPLAILNRLELHGDLDVEVGLGLYASTARSEFKNPGDTDLLLNTLIDVPDLIESPDEARRWVARRVVESVIGRLKNLARQNRIAITEFRVGSEDTLNQEDTRPSGRLRAARENPYLSQADVFRGSYTDTSGRTYSLEEMILSGDFVKFKIDLFEGQTYHDLSLQLIIGYRWRGNLTSLHDQALKSVPPLLRTAVYPDYRSYAIAALLQRPVEQYFVQRGLLLPNAVGDIIESYGRSGFHSPLEGMPLFYPKLIKRLYNFLLLADGGSAPLLEYFVSHFNRYFEREYSAHQVPDFDLMWQRYLAALNQRELATLNLFKRIINNFKEWSERGQVPTDRQWEARLHNLERLFAELDLMIQRMPLRSFEKFRTDYTRLKSLVVSLSLIPSDQAARGIVQREHGTLFDRIEKHVRRVESELVVRQMSAGELLWLADFSALLPHYMYRLYRDRGEMNVTQWQWVFRMWDITYSDSVIAQFEAIDQTLDTGSKQEILYRQRRLFSGVETCENAFNQRSVR